MPYIQELTRSSATWDSATIQEEFEIGPSPVKGDTGLLYLDVNLTGTFATANPSVVGDIGHAITSLDVVIAGKSYLRFNPPRADPDEAGISPLAYLLLKAGGYCEMEPFDVDGQVSFRGRMRIPVGRPTNKKESGYIRITFGATEAATTSWGNTATTTIASELITVQAVYGTVRHESHISSGINETISASAEGPVRIHQPEGGNWFLDKVVIHDDGAVDSIDTVRVVGLHEQPLDIEELRFLSGDKDGIKIFNSAWSGDTSDQLITQVVAGAVTVPCYGLSQSQTTLSVRSNSTGGVNYYYGIWYRAASGGTDQPAQPAQVQTSSATGGEQVLS